MMLRVEHSLVLGLNLESPVTFFGLGWAVATIHAYIHLPLHLQHNSNSKFMFNRNTFLFSVLGGLFMILCFIAGQYNLGKMPPKPKLNVQNFPRPPLLERTPRHLQIKWHGQTIADTEDAYWVLETYHPPSSSFGL